MSSNIIDKKEVNDDFESTKMIAFRDRDYENDIWCERVFLFKDEDDVRAFFTSNNSVLLEIYTEEDDPVLNDFEIHEDNFDKEIKAVSFFTEYSGDVTLCRMLDGFIIAKI